MLDNGKCQTLAKDLRSLLAHRDITVAGVAEVWVPTLDRAAERAEAAPSAAPNSAMDAILALYKRWEATTPRVQHVWGVQEFIRWAQEWHQ